METDEGDMSEDAVEIWIRRLAHFQRELAKASDAGRRFSIEEEIQEIKAKIVELGGEVPTAAAQHTSVPEPPTARPVEVRGVGVEKASGEAGGFDVFLCYNSQDRDAVVQIAETLKERGLRPWLDVWELRPGLPWQEALEEQIDTIGAAAVFIGPGGEGPWHKMELQAFLQEFVDHRRPVIPVILPEVDGKPKLPPFLRLMQWIDFRKQDPDPVDNMIWGVTGRKPGS